MGLDGDVFEGALQTTTSLLYLTDKLDGPPSMVMRINDRITVVELSDYQLANVVADGACIIARRVRGVEEDHK